jgi:hypothetical protein
MGSKSFAHYTAEAIVFSAFARKQRTTALARPAHNAPKEVASMNSTKLWMTDLTPSCFGMPISGHAFGTAATSVVRERIGATVTTGAVKQGLAATQSDFPGTTAWRPPSC